MTDTVDALLAEGRALGLDPGAVRALLAQRLDRSPTWLLAHGREPIAPEAFTGCRDGLVQLAAGAPLGQLLGVVDFAGLTLRVTEATLLPRPDTEVLLEGLLRRLPSGPLRVLDLGTGSGALALALKAARPELTVFASDISPDALAVAQETPRTWVWRSPSSRATGMKRCHRASFQWMRFSPIPPTSPPGTRSFRRPWPASSQRSHSLRRTRALRPWSACLRAPAAAFALGAGWVLSTAIARP